MNLLALLLLQASAVSGHAPAPPARAIEEVAFDSTRYCLPLANQRRFDLPKPNSRLVDSALANAEASGQNVSFYKALARQESGPAYYVFSLKKYFDIYVVYKTDAERKTLVRKFRYFSKHHPCSLPWPPKLDDLQTGPVLLHGGCRATPRLTFSQAPRHSRPKRADGPQKPSPSSSGDAVQFWKRWSGWRR